MGGAVARHADGLAGFACCSAELTRKKAVLHSAWRQQACSTVSAVSRVRAALSAASTRAGSDCQQRPSVTHRSEQHK
jgi:hypothetical protein